MARALGKGAGGRTAPTWPQGGGLRWLVGRGFKRGGEAWLHGWAGLWAWNPGDGLRSRPSLLFPPEQVPKPVLRQRCAW